MKARSLLLSAAASGLCLSALPGIGLGQDFEEIAERIDEMKMNQVELIEAGKGKKQAFSFKVEEGTTQTVEMFSTQDMEMSMAGSNMPMPKSPGSKLTMLVTVEEVEKDGGFAYSAEVVGTEAVDRRGVDEFTLEITDETMQNMVGMIEYGFIMSNGAMDPDSRELELPDDPSPDVEMMADQMANMGSYGLPLPEEPIGVGAVWEVAMSLDVMGAEMRLLTRYELTNIKDGMLDIDVTTYTVAAGENMANPMLPPGSTLIIDELFGETSGRALVDLFKPMPVRTEMNGETEMFMTLDMGGFAQEMEQVIEIEVTSEEISDMDAAEEEEDVGTMGSP